MTRSVAPRIGDRLAPGASSTVGGDSSVTVAELLAEAESCIERAALLSTAGFEIRDLFGDLGESTPVAYFVRRTTGGASAANPQVVEQVCRELFRSAENAREQARRLLALAAPSHEVLSVDGLDGQEGTTSILSPDLVRVPEVGDDITANPASPLARRRLDFRWTPP